MPVMSAEKPRSLGPALLLAGTLGAILVAAIVMAVDVWSSSADAGMSGHGYAAMAIGIIVTLVLGGGLMALVFYSSRHGYDDAAGPADEFDDRR